MNGHRLEVLALSLAHNNGGFDCPNSRAFKLCNPGLLKSRKHNLFKRVDPDSYRMFESHTGGFKALMVDLELKSAVNEIPKRCATCSVGLASTKRVVEDPAISAACLRRSRYPRKQPELVRRSTSPTPIRRRASGRRTRMLAGIQESAVAVLAAARIHLVLVPSCVPVRRC